MIPENIQISKLANGLNLLTINQPWKNGIYCYAYIKVGSCDEQLERDKGICHFIEHMVFRGTEDYTEDEITQMITGRGGYFNGGTSYSYTQYNMWSQNEHFGDTISILNNLIFKPLISSDTLDIERQIIIEEAMEHFSDPLRQALAGIYRLLYPKHNIQYPIVGTEESIKNINPTRMKEYLRGYYRPQTMILTLCGNLPEQSELEDILYNNAHGFIRKTRASNSSVLTRNFGELTSLTDDVAGEETWDDVKSSVSATSFSYDAEPLEKEERIALEVLTNIIGGDNNSLMFQQIRKNDGLCYSCGAYNTTLLDHLGSFSFLLFTRKSNIETAEKRVAKIIKDVLDGKIEDQSIEFAKNSLIGSTLRGLESGSYFSRVLSDAYLEDDEKYQVMPWEYDGLIRQVSKKQLVDVAHQIFEQPKANYRILNKD